MPRLARFPLNPQADPGDGSSSSAWDLHDTDPSGYFRVAALKYHASSTRMPRIYRTMHEQDGKPRAGEGFCELGVRPPGRTRPDGQPAAADVDVDAHGHVVVNRKGMSVFRSLADLAALPSRLVPIHLAAKVRGAAGPRGARIWTMGRGPFASGRLTDDLELHASGGVHGTVCPSHQMAIDALQRELTATQDSWAAEEP